MDTQPIFRLQHGETKMFKSFHPGVLFFSVLLREKIGGYLHDMSTNCINKTSHVPATVQLIRDMRVSA